MDQSHSDQLFSVKDMVVVIVGGGTGLEPLVLGAFARNGVAKIYIVGDSKEKLSRASARFGNGLVVPFFGDVTSKESLREITEQIQRETGYVNLVISMSDYKPPAIDVKASVTPVAEFARKALQENPEDWVKAFATNGVSIPFLSFAFLELLDAGNKKGNCPGRHSQILVTTSTTGYLPTPTPLGAYPASKAAATDFIKHLAVAFAPYSIRVNGIAPGMVAAPASGAPMTSSVPATQLGQTSDMAGTVLYMASAAAAYMNGNTQVLDGGRMYATHGAQ